MHTLKEVLVVILPVECVLNIYMLYHNPVLYMESECYMI